MKQHEHIKSQLRQAGSSLADIARELGVTRTSVTMVCKGLHRSQRIEGTIASKLGVTASQLWPSRYPVASTLTPTASPGGTSLPIT